MFQFTFDKKIIYIIIAIMAFATIIQYINNPGALFRIISKYTRSINCNYIS